MDICFALCDLCSHTLLMLGFPLEQQSLGYMVGGTVCGLTLHSGGCGCYLTAL